MVEGAWQCKWGGWQERGQIGMAKVQKGGGKGGDDAEPRKGQLQPPDVSFLSRTKDPDSRVIFKEYYLSARR